MDARTHEIYTGVGTHDTRILKCFCGIEVVAKTLDDCYAEHDRRAADSQYSDTARTVSLTG